MKYQLEYTIDNKIISRIFDTEEDARQWGVLVRFSYPQARITLYAVTN